MKFRTWPVFVLGVAMVPAGAQVAIPVAAVSAPAADEARVVLHGNVHGAVRDLMPESRCDPATPMNHLVLSFKMRPEAQARLEQLLADQQNPALPGWHQWLTPEAFAASFGPSPDDVARVSAWLRSQGFSIDQVARGGMTLNFSGDVDSVEQAFRTSIMNYRIQGRLYHANATDPSIPAALAEVVDGIVSLHNVPLKAKSAGFRPLASPAPMYTYGNGSHALAPADFATIYDVNPVYGAGIDGTGVTIAIVGRTNPTNALADWNTFRSDMGLPANPPTILINPQTGNPGDITTSSDNEDGEADLDVEWSGAVAPGASILFVCSGSSASGTDGALLSSQYIVNENLAPILSSSFGLCESELGTTGNQQMNTLWKQAAAQGITVCVAAGDSGASDCYDPPDDNTLITDVDGYASTPYNVSVGGTMFNDAGTGTTYWSGYTGITSPLYPPSAKSYIPEVVWNEVNSTGRRTGTAMASGGGVANGSYISYAKPAWQVAPGVSGSYREVPDVALNAGVDNDPYLVRTADSINGTGYLEVGGTSCGAPSFAAMMALVEQKNGQRQGNANVVLYQLGNAQYSHPGSAPAVFHDIVSGDNKLQVSGTGVFYSAGTGYDACSGLGSIDAAELVANWGAGVAIGTSVAGSVGLLAGTALPITATVTGTTDTSVTWSSSPAGATLTPAANSASATFSATTPGTYTVTAAATQNQSQFVTITIQVNAGNFMESGSAAPTGLDVLYLLGHAGVADISLQMAGTGQPVGAADWNALLKLLGWAS